MGLEGEQPSNKGYRLDELLRMLQEGNLPSGGDGYRVFNINSQPNIEGDFSFGPSGNPEIGFGQKFEEGFQGWEKGERVKTKYRVVKNEDDDGNKKYGLQVAESVVGDIRHSDTFYLDGLSPEEEVALAGVGMAEIEAVVQVKDQLHTEYQISNMQDYSATIDRIIEIQKPWDGNTETLQNNQSVLIEGEVVEYVQNQEYPYDGAHVTLKMKNGQTVPVKLWNGYLNIEDGIIENYAPNHPISGDAIQINTTYGNPGARYGKDEDTQFFAYFCRSTYLMKPEQQRQMVDETQRQFVRNSIAAIEQAETSQQIRQITASVISASYIEGSSLNLTNGEKRRINKLIQEKITDDGEKPLNLFEDMWGMEDLKKGYGIDPYGMSRNEYYDFCLQVARGQRKMVGDGASDSPWRVMRGNLTSEQEGQVLGEAITNLYPKVIGKRTIHKQDILVDPKDLPDLHEKSYGHRVGNKVVVGKKDYDPNELANPDNVTWEDQYLFDQTLKYFDDQVNTNAAEIYIGMARRMNEAELFMKTDEDRFREYGEYEIVDAMTSNAQNNIIWKDNKWGTEIVGLKDPQAARAYISQTGMFNELASRLEARGWSNDGARSPEQYVEKFMRTLGAIDLYLKQSNAQFN